MVGVAQATHGCPAQGRVGGGGHSMQQQVGRMRAGVGARGPTQSSFITKGNGDKQRPAHTTSCNAPK